ncbi:MAG: SUMF1/EgtB/PvdO family nonheme iron enzyme [Planctomycetia bacterium]
MGIFLSYRRADSEWVVGRIYDRLISHFPVDRVFRDLDSLRIGISFPQALDEAVTNARVALIVIGPTWASVTDPEGRRRLDNPADFVRLEVERALGAGYPVVPILVNRATMPHPEQLPESIRPLVLRLGLQVRTDPDFHRDMDRLIGQLNPLLDVDSSSALGGRVDPPPSVKNPPPAAAPSAPVFPFSAEEAKDYQRRYAAWYKQPLELTNSLGMKLVLIPPGRFLMGSPKSEKVRSNDEAQKDVTLTKPFYLGVYEVTQAEYGAVMGINPSHFTDVKGVEAKRLPVEQVSYDDALEFLAKLNERDRGKLPAGWKYLLPTEAQWEYACRAGSKTAFNFGDVLNGDKANCDGSHPYGTEKKGPYLQRPAPVGSYAPNGWGLYDMHGNVWEWCRDGYTENLPGGIDPFVSPEGAPDRVSRGGSWFVIALSSRSAYRYGITPDYRAINLGFRVAAGSE